MTAWGEVVRRMQNRGQVLPNDPGHEVEPVVDGRRAGLKERPLVTLVDFIVAQPQSDILWMGHRLDSGCITVVHSADKFQYAG
jgi:hypothetical protein